MKRRVVQSLLLRAGEEANKVPFVAKASRGINKVILLGNAGKDASVRTFEGGQVTFFPLATNQIYTTKTGERVNKPQWHNVVIYNENLGNMAKTMVKKGALVYVEGTLSTRTYTAQDGSQKLICEVVLPKYRGELNVLSGRPGEKDVEEGAEELEETEPKEASTA